MTTINNVPAIGIEQDMYFKNQNEIIEHAQEWVCEDYYRPTTQEIEFVEEHVKHIKLVQD